MTDRQFIDAATLSGARLTNDGYLVAEVRCARTGCQDYMASDFGMMGGDVITVYRPEEVVFDKASMATFAGKPVTMGHPADPVTADNWKALAVGDIGGEVARDGEYVRVPIKLMDAAAIRQVQDGTREISMGYSTGIKFVDGVAPDGTKYQAMQTGPIRINHLAIVPVARGGSNLRIGDGASQWGAAPLLIRKDAQMAENAIKTRTVLIDGFSVETTEAGAQALEKLQKDLADANTDHAAALAAKDKEIAAKDADLAARDAKIKEVEAKVLDAAALDKMVKDRADLIGRAKAITPNVVTDGKSAAEIKAAVVATKFADAAGKSEAYIDAAFDILAKDIKPADPLATGLGQLADAKPEDRAKAYEDRNRKLADAWKSPADKKEA